MKYYFNLFIRYLQDHQIEVSIEYFLLLQKIKESIESWIIDIWRWKMSDKLKDFFNNQNIDYYSNDTITINLDSLLCEDLMNDNQNLSVNRIDSLQVKNFRWFSQSWNEDNGCRFDFTGKQKIIIYWPNWSWKSSFSEALEYILTWDIKECKRKNKSLTTYTRNNQNLWASKITLNDDVGLFISSREKEFFKRCIIEKNRITEFSLFRSKDTGLDNHEDALTFLLWFEELDNFISSFVKVENFTLEVKDTAKKDLELYQRSQQDGRAIFESKVKEFTDLQNLLIKSNILLYNEDLKTHQHNTEMLKQSEQSISTLEKDLQIPTILRKIYKHTQKDFEDLIIKRTEKEKELWECIKQITEKKSEINFKKLYEAIFSIPEREICPACHTHKNQWIRNPFETAKKELWTMEEIIRLEENHKQLEKEIAIIIDANNILDQEKEKNQLQLAMIIDDLQEESYFSIIDKLLSEPIDIDEKQEELSIKKVKRDDLVSQIRQYDELELIISKWLQIWNSALEQQKQEAVRIENMLNIYLQNIITAYGSFRTNIDVFYRWYMEHETQGMWADVCEYYKRINEHDEESEQVTQIEPIINWNFTIKLVWTQGEITNDAVSYLSEWHLKALWLAVLWANMKKNDVPFMIFDDVVNAIDVEHRSNIIHILHSDEFLSSKQMIITTHDRLFRERFCNSFSLSDIEIRITYVLTKELLWITPKEYKEINHDEKISMAIRHYDIRQAVLYTRIWFEQMILNYCKKRNCEIKGNIKQSTISLYLETTIDLLYAKFYQKIQWEQGWDDEKNTAFEFLKNNILNWEIINQEWHAHDEQTRNIIHSITSNEITSIQNNARILNNYILSLFEAAH